MSKGPTCYVRISDGEYDGAEANRNYARACGASIDQACPASQSSTSNGGIGGYSIFVGDKEPANL